jgi:N-acetylmuramoyl-L-alanine amidase
MQPLFGINGLGLVRRRPEATDAEAVAASDAAGADLYVALASDAAAPPSGGKERGVRLFYAAGSGNGKAAATALGEAILPLYAGRVGIYPTDTVAELQKTKAPAVLAEVAFHDNLEDAQWLHENLQDIAAALVKGLCAYFGKAAYVPPCVTGSTPAARAVVQRPAYGRVCGSGGVVRATPGGTALYTLPEDEHLVILSPAENGSVFVRHNTTEGFMDAALLCVCNGTALPFTARFGVVAAEEGDLNVRREPSAASPVIGILPRGAELLITADLENYYGINYHGMTGYAAKRYVTAK